MRAFPRLSRWRAALWTVLCATVPVAVALVAPPGAASAEPATVSEEPVTVVSADFEDGTTQGWAARGAETVAASSEVAHGGTGSLAVTGRTDTWQGPTLNVGELLSLGAEYQVSLWVRSAEGSAGDTVRLSAERRIDGRSTYQTLGSAQVTSGGWVELSGAYTPSTEAEYLAFYVETASVTDGFFIDDAVVSYVPDPPIETDIPSLRDAVAGFPVGAGVLPADLYGSSGDLLVKHYESLTTGNALKWDATEPVEGDFRFTDADPIVDFATEHGMAVRGHTLVWHNQTPEWVFTDAAGGPMTPTPENKELLLDRLEAHIRAVVGRYGDRIQVWDVVNEVIDESQPDGLRRSSWYEIAGLDYIRTAFRVAHDVAPDARLFINDYNTNVPAKRDALLDLVSQLRAEGVPVHGVGHQMHINVEWPSVAEAEAMLQTFVPLGVEQQITEMDLSIYTNADESFPAPPEERLLAQAEQYRAMFQLFGRYADEVTSVTLWGVQDGDTWLDVGRKDAPLLFDAEFRAKSAFWAVVDPDWPNGPEPAGCVVEYRVVREWPGGFEGRATVTNTSAEPVDGWSLAWTFAQGQRLNQWWNGTASQSGGAVTVASAEWNGRLAAGGSATFGFLGTWAGANPSPVSFTLNGSSCAAG
ncbi:endo-1,4-beta-xylanase [Streptomyces sp. MP131-18]|uniref:endo-1,4-beta-xylanase n=1 Tax=Streptomyces sp. MP131-18 TaxID=1857892 RepID=UPI00097CAF99|nr:endo-1,4-beta-xylanase [Streptomyces sp. MP131-18]ONK16241.1 Endo-1,4-beta-xylanase A precursor [Streptomyces sp. MP131-18]